MAIAIASVNILFAGSPPYDSLKKMSFSPEKEKQIIEVARKVCEELAPDYMPDRKSVV